MLEWDFEHVLHCDALDWVRRKRPWPQFMRYMNRLGRIPGTAYYEALMLDPELAKAVAEARGDSPPPTHPQLFGYTSVHHMLADLGDIAIYSAGGDESNRLKRPLMAVDFLKLEKRQTNMRKLFADWFPGHMDKVPTLKPR